MSICLGTRLSSSHIGFFHLLFFSPLAYTSCQDEFTLLEKNACFSQIRPRADLLVDALDEILAEDHLKIGG